MATFLALVSFALATVAFCYGAYYLFRKELPKYFQLYVCAAGCYMLEELWVIVNSLLGDGVADGLITVRLIGFFGCLCFLLSANANQFDMVVDEGNDKKAKTLAFTAPTLLFALMVIYFCSTIDTEPLFISILE